MDLSIDTIAQSSTEFQMLFSLFYGCVVSTQEQLDAVDFINFTDPDLYLFNTAGKIFLKADGTIDLIVEGLENSGAFQEIPDAFFYIS